MPFILVYEETGVYISNIYVVIKVKNNFFKATYVELIFLLIFYSRKFSLSLYQNVSNSGENECLLLVEMFRIFLSSIIDNTALLYVYRVSQIFSRKLQDLRYFHDPGFLDKTCGTIYAYFYTRNTHNYIKHDRLPPL